MEPQVYQMNLKQFMESKARNQAEQQRKKLEDENLKLAEIAEEGKVNSQEELPQEESKAQGVVAGDNEQTKLTGYDYQPFDQEQISLIEKVISLTLTRAQALEKLYKCEIEEKQDSMMDQTQLKIVIFNLCREIKQIFISLAGTEEENKIQQFLQEQKAILKNKGNVISTLSTELG